MNTDVGHTAGRRRPASRIGAAATGIDALWNGRTTRVIGLAVAVAVGLVGSLAIIATPAGAAVPGLIRVSAISGSTSDDTKTMVVACPAGKQLVGTGARIDGGGGEVGLTSLWPDGSPTVAPTSVTAIAQEADPISGNWTLTVYGICANPLPGLVRISERSNANQSEDFKLATPMCPSGKFVVGTGFSIVHGRGQVAVGAVHPTTSLGDGSTPNRVYVNAAESDQPYSENWTVYAFAICAIPPAGLAVYTAETRSDSVDKFVVAQCPFGKLLLGAGILEPHGPFGHLVLAELAPNGGPTTAPDSVRATQYEEDAVAFDWGFEAYAICATRWK
jgi:hypothetical protein